MSAPQREGRPLFMIKQGGPPLRAVVALGAACDVCHGKLLSMDILMAVFTGGRRRLEVDVGQIGFEVRRFVAVSAGGRAVSTKQRKFGLRVIEG